MKRKALLSLTSLLALALLIGACRRTSDSFGGPKKVEARSDFHFSTPLHYMYNVDTKVSTQFDPTVPLGRIMLTAPAAQYSLRSDFSQEVTWFLEIYQPLTGAKKSMSGTSSKLDVDNMLWDGTTSNNIIFDAISSADVTDSLIVTLRFLGTDVSYSHRMKHKGAVGGSLGEAGYTTYLQRRAGGRCIVVDDFDGQGNQYDAINEFTDSRMRQEFFDAADGEVVLENSYTYSANKQRSFHLKGTDKNKNAYIGGVNTFSLESLTNPSAPESLIPNVDPSDLYLNVFVYGVSNQTTLQLKVYELDHTQNYQSVNPGFVYNAEAQKTNDAWTYDLVTNWTGWKLVSVKYSDFKRANDPNLGGNGNGVKEPNRVSGLAITLSSQDAFPSGEAYIDFVNFTTYSPLIP